MAASSLDCMYSPHDRLVEDRVRLRLGEEGQGRLRPDDGVELVIVDVEGSGQEVLRGDAVRVEDLAAVGLGRGQDAGQDVEAPLVDDLGLGRDDDGVLCPCHERAPVWPCRRVQVGDSQDGKDWE